MSDSAYRTLTEDEYLYKTLVWDNIIEGAIYAAEIYPPTSFLGFPVAKQVFEGVVKSIGDWIYKSMILFIDIKAIKFINDAHQATYDKVYIQLKITAHDKGIDSPEFKKERNDAKADLSRFTRFGQ